MPAATKSVTHDGAGKGGGLSAEVLFRYVWDDFEGLGSGEQGDAGAVAVEAEVAVVGDNVDGRVPGDLRWCTGTWTDVVDGTDVDAVEAEAWSEVEHGEVGRVGGRKQEEVVDW